MKEHAIEYGTWLVRMSYAEDTESVEYFAYNLYKQLSMLDLYEYWKREIKTKELV